MGTDPVLIVADAGGEDLAAVSDASGDFSVGTENTWSLQLPDRYGLSQGCYAYLDGTEFGGVVDDVELTSGSRVATLSGRTWQGMLASAIVCPPAGESHYVADGEANACIAEVLGLAGAGEPFSASDEDSGVEVDSYRMARYCDAWAGVTAMLASAGATLRVRFRRGSCELSAVRAAEGRAYSGDLDMVTRRTRACNHLVCLGSGELAARDVVHLYADAQGRVSRTQSVFGAAHMAEVYELSNAKSEAELVEKGTEKLASMQSSDSGEIDGELSGDWELGQTVTAYDEEREAAVSEVVTDKIARVSGPSVSVEYKTGAPEEAGEEPA